MVTWPSGKARVCKTLIHQFKSGRHLHKTVMKKMSQSFFFVVASKIGDFANQFLDTVLQCCPTIFGRFAHPEAHFFCRFLEFGRGVGNLFEKKQNKSCCFQNVFNFLAANSRGENYCVKDLKRSRFRDNINRNGERLEVRHGSFL